MKARPEPIVWACIGFTGVLLFWALVIYSFGGVQP